MASSKVFSTETRALTVLTNAKLDWMTICEIFDSAIQLHEAGRLAADLLRLTDLRITLRSRMLASPLMDANGFARHMEAAYRMMWRNWCAFPGATRGVDVRASG